MCNDHGRKSLTVVMSVTVTFVGVIVLEIVVRGREPSSQLKPGKRFSFSWILILCNKGEMQVSFLCKMMQVFNFFHISYLPSQRVFKSS